MSSRTIPEASNNDTVLVDALQRKRQSLDQDVLKFRALKDEEFRRFEQELRRYSIDSGEKPSGLAELRGIAPNGQMDGLGQSFDAKSTNAFLLDSLAISTTEGEDSVPQDLRPSSWNDSPYRERELELREFIPSYLPLLDIESVALPKSRRPSPPPSPEKSSSMEATIRHPLPPLSSSAMLPPAIYDSFESTESIESTSEVSASASLPSLDRRSSSKSDASANLRSSLKSTKSPKSPKHVLFAIGSNVVSPSTSPLALRNPATASPLPLPKTFASSLQDRPIHQVLQSVDIAPQGRLFHKSSSHDSLAKLSTAAFRKSYQRLLEPLDGTPLAAAKDFEPKSHDDDSLFSFDEELKPNDDDFEDIDSTDDDKELSLTNGKSGKNFVVAESPRVGSLPIEIRYGPKRSPFN